MIEKGPIFVSGIDRDKGYAIVKKLPNTPNRLRLDNPEIYANVVDKKYFTCKRNDASWSKCIGIEYTQE